MQFFRKFRSCTSNNQSFTFLGLVRDNVVISINILDNENDPKQFAVQPPPRTPTYLQTRWFQSKPGKPGGTFSTPNPVVAQTRGYVYLQVGNIRMLSQILFVGLQGLAGRLGGGAPPVVEGERNLGVHTPPDIRKILKSLGGVINPKIFFAFGDWEAPPPDPPLVPTNPQIIFAKASLCFQPQNDVETFVAFDNRKY